MKKVQYQDLTLKNVSKYCPSRIFEMYVHPPVGVDLIKFSAHEINREFSV